MSVDIRDRIICTAFSAVSSEKDIRSAMAFSAEHGFKSCLLDLSGVKHMYDEVLNYKKISISINLPFGGLDKNSTISILKEIKYENFYDVYISFDKFIINKSNLALIRDFVKESNDCSIIPINFCVEYSWIKNKEIVDKICSILEPYEKHGLCITTFCNKPDKLGDIISVGKHLGSNGSCKYSYLGAIPDKKDGIIEILSSGFSFCGIPKQLMSIAI